MANTRLYRTQATGTSRQKWTLSMWVKKCGVGGHQGLMSTNNGWQDGSGMAILLEPSGILNIYNPVQDATGSYNQSTRKFNDTNGYYHFVFSADSTQATQADRLKIYVNGEQLSYTTSNLPSQNIYWNDLNYSGQVLNIGCAAQSVNYFDGIMSHVNFADGTAYAPTVFGSTDATTGEWKINTNPTFTLGINGFTILKDGNTITDQSTNSNDFTSSGGGVTPTEDNPSNVFVTMNPLARYSGNLNYSNGNNTTTGSANDWTMGSSTLGASTGKWYYEYKLTTSGTANGYFKLGFISDQAFGSTGHIAESALDGGYAFYCQNGNLEVRTDGAVISGYDISTLGVSFSMGDIMCLAVDMDNKRAYFRKNDDAWIKSANPVTGTNGLDISADYTAGKAMIPAVAIYYPGVASLNFGNGYFGTTAVSSAGTNASGIGIFEYDVPTGFTALSTKGLNL